VKSKLDGDIVQLLLHLHGFCRGAEHEAGQGRGASNIHKKDEMLSSEQFSKLQKGLSAVTN